MDGISATNIIGLTYESIAAGRLEQIKTAMNAVIGAETTFMVPILRSLFLIFIAHQGLLTMYGHMTMHRLVGSIIRVGIIVLLITHAGEFTTRVQTPIFETIPQAISNTILSSVAGGTSNTQTLAQQFDSVSAAADALTALVASRSTSWSVSGLVNYLTAWVADAGMQILLGIIAAVWLLGQTLLAIILCFGPLLLVFELFDRTRGWVDQWIGKLVGMTAFGIGTSILLAIQMQGLINLMRSSHDGMPTSGDAAVAVMFHIMTNILLDAFTMMALPLICSIGSGVAASLAAPSALMTMRILSGAGTVAKDAGMATGSALGSAATNIGRANSIRN